MWWIASWWIGIYHILKELNLLLWGSEYRTGLVYVPYFDKGLGGAHSKSRLNTVFSAYFVQRS